MGYLVVRAINDFKFPRVSLEYDFDSTINDETGEAYGYYFISSKVTQKEISVILARMKQY